MRLTTASLCAAATHLVSAAVTHPDDPNTNAAPLIQPDHDSARNNAHRIFNSIHSAGRQWGSSLNHNGFGLIPGIVPRGTLLYHGTFQEQPPESFEWLAFEVEHAESFAASRQAFYWPPDDDDDESSEDSQSKQNMAQEELNDQTARLELRQEQQPVAGSSAQRSSGQETNDGYIRGYLHTYQATRDLHVLYVDGMSAGKSDLGTMDSQDLLLLERDLLNSSRRQFGEMERAAGLCELARHWGLDAIARAEIGFELIHCDFTNGVELLHKTRTFTPRDVVADHGMNALFNWARAVAQRYDGIGGDRLRLDFSSAVSGFFFPINVSNTDPERPDLIRLAASTGEDLAAIKTHVGAVVKGERSFAVNWQAVVDMVIGRYAERLVRMTTQGVGNVAFISEVESATWTYIDAPRQSDDVDWTEEAREKNRTADAMQQCAATYLLQAEANRDRWQLWDELTHTALLTVMEDICTTLFTARSLLLEASGRSPETSYFISHRTPAERRQEQPNRNHDKDEDKDDLHDAVAAGRRLIDDLRRRLEWTEWKKVRRCGEDAMMYVAMWPFGTPRDHWEPGCRRAEDLMWTQENYWGAVVL